MQAENSTSGAVSADNSTFLARFEHWRRRRGLTEEVAAGEIGYSRSWVQKLKRGDISPNKKAWAGLERAEGKNAPAPLHAASAQPAPSPQPFQALFDAAGRSDFAKQANEYITFLRLCREEADRMVGVNSDQKIEIFDKMVATWLVHTNSPTPDYSVEDDPAIDVSGVTDGDRLRYAGMNDQMIALLKQAEQVARESRQDQDSAQNEASG